MIENDMRKPIGARLASKAWFDDLHGQCGLESVPFYMKTLGTALEKQLGKPRGWLPKDLQIRQFPKGHKA